MPNGICCHFEALAAAFYATRSPSDEQVRKLERKLIRESISRLPDFIEDAREYRHFVDSIDAELGEDEFRSCDGFSWSESTQMIDEYRDLCRGHYQFLSIKETFDAQSPEEIEIGLAELIHDFQIVGRSNFSARLFAGSDAQKDK